MAVTEVYELGKSFEQAVDAALPGRLRGLYLVGSAALGDWQAKLSNVDVVAVADEVWDDATLLEATGAHGLLDVGRRSARIVYASYEELALDPSAAAPPCFDGRGRIEPGEMANPFTWAVLGSDGVAVRGPEYFPVHRDEEALRSWALGRLAGRWRSWADASRRWGPDRSWRRRRLTDDLLEVTRLHVVASRGQVVSKLRSGPMALEDLPGRFERVVADATGYRQGSRTSMYWGPIERKRHALELIEDLTGRAAGELVPGS